MSVVDKHLAKILGELLPLLSFKEASGANNNFGSGTKEIDIFLVGLLDCGRSS